MYVKSMQNELSGHRVYMYKYIYKVLKQAELILVKEITTAITLWEAGIE